MIREEFVSRQQVNLIAERLRKAEETSATKSLYNYLWDLFEKNDYNPMRIMVVGAGGSYPAAIFAKYVISDELRTPYVEAMTPQTAIRIFTQFDYILNSVWDPKYDLVIGISYSGKTPDIKNVSDICKKKHYPFVLVTGAEKSSLTELYKESENVKIISYFNYGDNTGKEKGMISMVSTLAPAIIFDDNYTAGKLISENQKVLSDGEKYVSELDIPNIAKLIKQTPIIHVFYEWDTLATAADIESKFTESGIANVVLHEKKNFSHGRYTSLYNQNFSLVINLTRYTIGILMNPESYKKLYRNDFDKSLSDFLSNLCKEKSAYYLEVGNVAMKAGQWNIEEMAKLPYFITSIGEELDVDISKPLNSFPKEASSLYDYKGKF